MLLINFNFILSVNFYCEKIKANNCNENNHACIIALIYNIIAEAPDDSSLNS